MSEPVPAPHSDFDREGEDTFHTAMFLSMDAALNMIGYNTNSANRWQVRWVCPHCSDLHKVTGTLEQVQATVTAMFVLGYPMVMVHDLAFLEFMHMNGDIADMNDRIRKAADEYREHCYATRGG